ncbi:MAG: hypothetical protein CSA15_03830 [Candidatus Delongbacteria bacterium]|nr:MAG: hypothetical protein CSA15_03830 [Candidatus Delongbacteria bacterium]
MKKTDDQYQRYLDILREELIPAMGCTEPIAIAYAAARAREELGEQPEKVEIIASANILKNVNSVVVPNTGGLKGMEASAAAGIVGGISKKVLEVISHLESDDHIKIKQFLDSKEIKIRKSDRDLMFDLEVNVFSKESKASVHIAHYHTNIVSIKKDDQVIYDNLDCNEMSTKNLTDRSKMSVESILDFVESVDINEVAELLQRQVDYNTAIAEEGLKGNWGANIGSVLLGTSGEDIKIRAKAYAAAGSDARMSGCKLPVMIVSGSGNQGMTASLPVVMFAKELKSSKEDLYRALLVSNLVTIHQKTGIGRLSAYCGAISAGVGAGSGIAWLHGGRYDEISHTIVNALAIASGVICDGAKPSCAAKIALSVEGGILGYFMYKEGQKFCSGDGIVTGDVENTIANIGRVASRGMKETDKEIINIMLGE